MEEATQYCAGLELAGVTDWSLPTLVELSSIVDYGETTFIIGATINKDAFPDAPSADFWTSTEYRKAAFKAYYVRFSFDVPRTGTEDASVRLFVRCVRGRTAPSGYRYSMTSSTVTDGRTGLTWERTRNFNLVTLAEAPAECPQGWRLPTGKELQSLVSPGEPLQPIDSEAFPGTPESGFWTSSIIPDFVGLGKPQIVNFATGTSTGAASLLDPYHYVRCVR